eukprot:GHUV01035439.1.p1 GENE.GHUV01035439.1~~GHUV01035439.1.p1  ORF type:complete len:101 (-),score=12.58 GHUV01035439.1:176-478(-)
MVDAELQSLPYPADEALLQVLRWCMNRIVSSCSVGSIHAIDRNSGQAPSSNSKLRAFDSTDLDDKKLLAFTWSNGASTGLHSQRLVSLRVSSMSSAHAPA